MGELLGALAGIGFGVMQSFNRRGLAWLSVFQATLLQLTASTLVLAAILAAQGDLPLLWRSNAAAVGWFVVAGLVHFALGTALFNAGQNLIGAVRTGPLLATPPLFGIPVAAVTLGEIPRPLEICGVVLIVGGVFLLSRPGRAAAAAVAASAGSAAATDVPSSGNASPPEGAASPSSARGPAPGVVPGHSPRVVWMGSLAALGAALCWAVSPVFIREGLKTLDSPLVGVTVGMAASTLVFAVAAPARWAVRSGGRTPGRILGLELVAGTILALSHWARWEALALAPVGVVLALVLLSVPTVILLAPLLSGRHGEDVTARTWWASGVIVAGALLVLIR